MIALPRALAVPAAAVIAVGMLAACQSAAPADDGPRDLKMSLYVAAQLPANWDPTSGFVTTYFAPTQAVYESLIVVGQEDYDYEPWLASEFSISDDRTTLSLTLREDVDFVDGVHFDAEAAKASLDAVLQAELAPYFRIEMSAPQIDVTGEYELVITSETGISRRFLDALAILPIASPEALKNPEELAAKPVGTGAYLIDTQVPEVSASYVRNPDYYAPERFAFDTLEFTVFADRVAALNALKSGQINLAELNPQLAGEAEASGFSIFTGGGDNVTLCWIDRAGVVQPALADLRVRQAINYALDRVAINESLNGEYGIPRSQGVAPNLPEYIEGGDDEYPYDLERARELMAEAGYADGFDLTILERTDYDYLPPIVQALEDIGIRVTIERHDVAGFFAAVPTSALVPYRVGDNYLVSYLDKGGFMNLGNGGAVAPELVDILAAINSGTVEESAEASQELGRFLLDELWYTPVFRRLAVFAGSPDLDFFVGNIAGIPPALWNIHVR